MATKLTRRRLLIGAGVGTLGLTPVVAVARRSEVQVVHQLLRKHLPGIDVPQAAAEAYHADLLKLGKAKVKKALPYVAALWAAYPLLALPGLRDRLEQRIVVDFLLSSDFFRDEAVRGGDKPVTYRRFRRKRDACSNPFANFSQSP